MDTCLRAVRTDQEKVRQNNGTEPAYSLLPCTSDHFYKPQVKEVKEMVLSDLKAAASVQTFHRFICQICIYLDICVYLVLNAFFHRYLSVKTLAWMSFITIDHARCEKFDVLEY